MSNATQTKTESTAPWAVLANKLSPIVVNGIAITMIILVVGAIFYAITTNREIEFWPPRIGPNKTLLKKLNSIQQSLDTLQKNEQIIRLNYIEKLSKAREASLNAQAFLNMGSSDAARMEKEAKEQLDEENKLFVNKINKIDEQLNKIVDTMN